MSNHKRLLWHINKNNGIKNYPWKWLHPCVQGEVWIEKTKCWWLFICITSTSKETIAAKRDLINVWFFFCILLYNKRSEPWRWSPMRMKGSSMRLPTLSLFKSVTPFHQYLSSFSQGECLIVPSDLMDVYVSGLWHRYFSPLPDQWYIIPLLINTNGQVLLDSSI